jgi:hypothetical protein
MEEKRFEKIEDYLNGTMSSEEKVSFEAELASNDELASEFKLYRMIEEEMRGHVTNGAGEDALRISLEALTKKYFSTEPKNDEQPAGVRYQSVVSNTAEEVPEIRKMEVILNGKEQNKVRVLGTWKKLAVAAVLFGACVMGSIWLLERSRKSPKVAVTAEKTDVQKKNIEPDTTSPVLNSSPNDVVNSGKDKKPEELNKESTTERLTTQLIDRKRLESLYMTYLKPDALPQPNESAPDFDANESYKRGKYKEAIASLAEVIDRIESPESSTRGEEDERSQYLFYAYYYKAQSYLGIDSVVKAIPDLRKALKNSPDSYWKSKVQWYLALTYLKKEQVQEAEALLKQVANHKNAGEYKQKANGLLSELMNAKKTNSRKM